MTQVTHTRWRCSSGKLTCSPHMHLPSTTLHCPTPSSITRGRAGYQRWAPPPQCSTQCSSPARPDPHPRSGALSTVGRCCLERHSVLGPLPELHPPQGTPSARLTLAGTTVSPPPTSVQYYTCDYCDAHVDHPWSHVARSCPTFLVRSQWALVRLLITVPKMAGSYLPESTTVVQPASNTSITVALETDLHTPSPLPLHRWSVFSPYGLVRSAHPSSAAQDGTGDRFRVVLEAMAWLPLTNGPTDGPGYPRVADLAQLNPQPACVGAPYPCPATVGGVPRPMDPVPPTALANAGGGSTAHANAPPPPPPLRGGPQQ